MKETYCLNSGSPWGKGPVAEGVVQWPMGGRRTGSYRSPEESAHLAEGRLEDFPEEEPSGSWRMNRSWPDRKAGPRVGVGVGETGQRQGWQAVSGTVSLIEE